MPLFDNWLSPQQYPLQVANTGLLVASLRDVSLDGQILVLKGGGPLLVAS